jgi:hypothetical protein
MTSSFGRSLGLEGDSVAASYVCDRLVRRQAAVRFMTQRGLGHEDAGSTREDVAASRGVGAYLIPFGG